MRDHMGWASTDNARSLGLSASKFIILSDSDDRALLPGPRGSQEIVERGRSGPLSTTSRACRVRDLQDGVVPLPSFPASLACSLSHGIVTVRYKFYLSSVQERREEAVSQLRAGLSLRTPIKGTNWTAIHQSRSREWVLRAPGIH